jgi:hypothetical protein
MPSPRDLRDVQTEGRQLIAWFGDLSGPLDLPSGPSCYIFDTTGKLVDWQVETGDGGPVENLLQASAQERSITLAEALQILATVQPEQQNRAKK